MAYIVKRGTSWFAQIRKVGQPSVSRSFPTKSLASEWARNIEKEMDDQKYQDVKPMKNITLATLIDRYVEEIGGTKGFAKNKEAVLKSLKAALGHKTIGDLNNVTMIQFVNDRMKAGAGGVTVNIDLTYLSGVYKVAGELWNIRCDVDALKAAKASLGYKGITTKSRSRTRRPTRNEIDRLIAYYRSRSTQQVPMWDIIPFAIETAMRLGEICSITWGDVNVDDKTVIIRDRKHPTAKQGNDQVVPLLGTSWDILQAQPRPPVGSSDQRVFPYSASTISSIFPRACQSLGIDDLHFHDFRHEGVSRLFEQGYAIEQVSLVSGHQDWSMLRRYVQLNAKDLHRGPRETKPSLTH